MSRYSGTPLFFFSLLVSTFAQLPFDNEVVGDPDINCLMDSMSFSFVTKSAFEGHVFVKEHFHEAECHKDYVMNTENRGFMDLDYKDCNMKRNRMSSPRGMAMSAVIVVSFHRNFITHMDKAYHISCFYKEEERPVQSSLEVSPLTADPLDVHPPMPQCKYEVMDGPGGNQVTFARIGDTIYHQWSCDYPMPDMYCMLIHSCNVSNGVDAEEYEVVDSEGCSTDDVILGELTYMTDLVAGTPAQVFKFADRPHVHFNCKVTLSLKMEQPNQTCPIPSCSRAPPISIRRRIKRDERKRKNLSLESEDNDFDLLAPPLTVLDIEEAESTPSEQLRSESSQRPRIQHFPFVPAILAAESETTGVCLSEVSFGVLMAAALLSCLTTILFAAVYCFRSRYFKP